MKKSLLAAAITAVLIGAAVGGACMPVSAKAAAAEEAAVVVVTGTAQVAVQAEGYAFCGYIERTAEDMQSAASRSEEAAEKARAAFSPYGQVEEEHFSVRPVCGGYKAVRSFRFITEQADKLSEMRSALAGAGVTSLEGAVPFCKEESAHRSEALRAALEEAKRKAAELGASGGLVRVEELYCFVGTTPSGEVRFEASVRAVFARLPQAGGGEAA